MHSLDRRIPFPHQLVGAQFIADRRRCGLWWEPRTCKTLTSLLGVRLAGAKRLLVLAPVSIHSQWRDEAKREGFDLAIANTKIEGKDGLIITYESVWRTKHAIDPSTFDAVIFDESIKMQSANTKLATWLHEMIHDLPDIRIALSGAPCPESPLQAMHQLYIVLGRDFPYLSWWHYLRNNWRYDERSYKWKPIGNAVAVAKAFIAEHGNTMTQAELGFRTEKLYEELRIPASTKEIKVFNAILDADSYIDRDGNKCAMLDITRAMFLQIASSGINPLKGEAEIVGSSKIDGLTEWIVERLEVEPQAQFVIFAKHTTVLQRMHQSLTAKSLEAFIMNGSTSGLQRAEYVKAFHAGKYRCAVIQSRVGEVGLDLSCANFLLYLENSWSGNTRIQSEERCTNINKKDTVLVVDVCTQFPEDRCVDADIADAVRSKKDANDKLLLANLRTQNANRSR